MECHKVFDSCSFGRVFDCHRDMSLHVNNGEVDLLVLRVEKLEYLTLGNAAS